MRADTHLEEPISDLPGENGGIFTFQLSDFEDDRVGSHAGLAAADRLWLN